MSDLKIGGFKNNESSAEQYDLDFSKPDESSSEQVEQVEQDVIKNEVDESSDWIEPVPQPKNNNDSTKEVELESSLTSNVSDPIINEVEKKPVEINDELALNYLSEKLGKKIQSLDELTPKQESILDDDPYLKELYEWRKKTGRPIEDWIKYQKDYTKVNDLEVAREFLQYEYPTFTQEEIDAELESLRPNEDDYEQDASTKLRNLKKYATKGREVLNQMTSKLGEVSYESFPAEIKQDLELAKQVKQQQTISQKFQKEYDEGIKNASMSLDNLKLKLDDNLVIDYKLSEINRKKLPEIVNTMSHWYNEDGTYNHKAVVADAVKIQYFDDIIKLAYEQGLNSGKDSIIRETKNTTLGESKTMSGNTNNQKGVVIEGFKDFIGEQGVKLRFKK
jgi:hypothetical protein